MTDSSSTYADYAAFWPFYLSQHRRRATRFVHIIGTLLALVAMLGAIIAFNPWWFIAAPVIGYGPAWISHALVEKNCPATFTYPFWSLCGDFQMLKLWLAGELEAELVRCGV